MLAIYIAFWLVSRKDGEQSCLAKENSSSVSQEQGKRGGKSEAGVESVDEEMKDHARADGWRQFALLGAMIAMLGLTVVTVLLAIREIG